MDDGVVNIPIHLVEHRRLLHQRRRSVLLRWWRWLRAIGTQWDRATPSEARDLVLWLRQATKPRRWARTTSASTAGTINAVTRKRHLGDRYEARTIRHNNAVLRTFYEFWIERGEGPLINPVRLDRGGRGRPNAHHNPLEPFRAEGRIRYNPKLPKAKPRRQRLLKPLARSTIQPGTRKGIRSKVKSG